MRIPKFPIEGLASGRDALARAKRELASAKEVPFSPFERRQDAELNALEAVNDVCEWQFEKLTPSEKQALARRYLGDGMVVSEPKHLAHLLKKVVPSFKLARDLANARKHPRLKNGVDVFTTSSAVSDVHSAPYTAPEQQKRAERRPKVVHKITGCRYRMSDVASDVVKFWEDFDVDPVGAPKRHSD